LLGNTGDYCRLLETSDPPNVGGHFDHQIGRVINVFEDASPIPSIRELPHFRIKDLDISVLCHMSGIKGGERSGRGGPRMRPSKTCYHMTRIFTIPFQGSQNAFFLILLSSQ